MRFSTYLKASVWDFVFCLMAAGGLAYTVFSGFYATKPLLEPPTLWAVLGACAVLLAALFMVAYNMKTAVGGGIGLAVVAVGVFIACATANPGTSPADDVEGNYAMAVLLGAALTLWVFLMSRKRGGTIVLLIIGSLLCALIEYLYWCGHVLALAVFLVGAVGLVAFKCYQGGIEGSDTDRLAFTSVSLVALVLAVAALAVGFGVYKLVVEPMDPPNVQVTLVVEHRRQEEVKIVGTGAASTDTGGDSGNEANGAEEETDKEAADLPRDTFQNGILSMLGMNTDQTGDAGTTTSLEQLSYMALFLALLLVALIAAVIVVRKLLRRRRFNRLCEGGNEAVVENLYRFFLSRFAKMKVPQPESLTLGEYCKGFESTFTQFERFAPADGTTFGDLTDIYIRAAYGGEPMGDADRAAFEGYYRVFYKNAVRYVGRFKYLFKFFTL